MALPTYEEQTSLEFIVNGLPYVNVTSSPTIQADGIHFIINGLPYYATSPGGAPPVTYNTTQFFMLF